MIFEELQCHEEQMNAACGPTRYTCSPDDSSTWICTPEDPDCEQVCSPDVSEYINNNDD